MRQRVFVATCVLACGAAGLAMPGIASSLKEKPPKGMELHGLWQLDAYRSDDPDKVLAEVKSDMEKQAAHERGGRGGGRGRYPGGGGFPGGGGGFPGGGGSDGDGFPGGGGGGWGHGGGHHRRDSDSSDHPDGDAANGKGPPREQMLKEIINNPATLDFALVDRSLKISAEQMSVECAAGVKVAISDSAGNAERNCGWDGRAWVVETVRGKALTRTDRYELSKDGKTLTYVTTASGARLPKIKLTRTYTSMF